MENLHQEAPYYLSRQVILSDQPVVFLPSNKTSNVVMVDSLDDAVRYVNVATQTIGVYRHQRKAQLRDRLASAGAQRLCRLGTANAHARRQPARCDVSAAAVLALDGRRQHHDRPQLALGEIVTVLIRE